MKNVAIAAVLAAVAWGGAAAAQDAAAGEELFARRCSTCHMIVDDAGDTVVKGGRTGPNQWGVIGRQAGSRADFDRYGDALVAAGESGLVWTEDEVVKYLEDPRGYLREYLGDSGARSRMAFKLSKADERANVAAYLATMQ